MQNEAAKTVNLMFQLPVPQGSTLVQFLPLHQSPLDPPGVSLADATRTQGGGVDGRPLEGVAQVEKRAPPAFALLADPDRV